jgi:hypothetical protein
MYKITKFCCAYGTDYIRVRCNLDLKLRDFVPQYARDSSKKDTSQLVHYILEANTEKIRYCQRCEEMFQIHARLGPRIMPLDDATGKPIPQPSDYDLWLECRNCGTVFPKHETKVEPILEPIVVLIHLAGLRCRE